MKKINIFFLCGFLLFPNLLEASSKWGLKKPSTHIGDVKPYQTNNLDNKVSLALGLLNNTGDMGEYESGFSADVLVACDNSYSFFGTDIGTGFSLNISGLKSDNDLAVDYLSMGSIGLILEPKLSLPIDFSFGTGLGYGETQLIGYFGFISFDMFYRLPFCKNFSLGLQYKNIIDTEDGEIQFSKVSNLGISLRIDG
tara:strand:+ start:2362 stop:2952 length:591 start_codon:yes stop_codon:yes gene_type:complete